MNFRRFDAQTIGISLDETTGEKDVLDILAVFNGGKAPGYFGVRAGGQSRGGLSGAAGADQPVPETGRLQHASFGNGNAALFAAAGKPGFIVDNFHDPARLLHDEAQRHGGDAAHFVAGIRPAASLRALSQTRGYQAIFRQLEDWLAEITGLAGLFPATQLRRARRIRRPAGHPKISRDARPAASPRVCLIPTSAHGTNPASAAMIGWDIVTVACDAGEI
jgi:glycine dehydrogenase